MLAGMPISMWVSTCRIVVHGGHGQHGLSMHAPCAGVDRVVRARVVHARDVTVAAWSPPAPQLLALRAGCQERAVALARVYVVGLPTPASLPGNMT